MKKFLTHDWIASTPLDIANFISHKNEFILEGNNHFINGNHKVAHLLKIHNCQKVIIRNVRFINGNTEAVKQIPRQNIHFPDHQISVFEIIDGGGVLITGNSNVLFENCHFEGNKSIMCGGAISNQSTGLVAVKNCTFENNTAGHTGSAIDNLTRGAKLVVENSKFINNISNTWHQFGYPHGQISAFPHTTVTVKNSYFWEGSIPIDYTEASMISFKNNKYEGYTDWKESTSIKGKFSLFDLLKLAAKLYWVLPKTFGKVYYRVNKD